MYGVDGDEVSENAYDALRRIGEEGLCCGADPFAIPLHPLKSGPASGERSMALLRAHLVGTCPLQRCANTRHLAAAHLKPLPAEPNFPVQLLEPIGKQVALRDHSAQCFARLRKLVRELLEPTLQIRRSGVGCIGLPLQAGA